VAALVSMSISSTASEPVLLHAAGSLRAPLTEVVKTFAADTGLQVQPKFGASGLLKDEILSGAPAGVFASANLEHPKALAQAKRAGPVVLFARNKLCALVRPDLVVDPATLLDRMLDSNVKLGTSTPRADPSGDYAWEVFRKADALRPGAFSKLEQKALQLTGGPGTKAAPTGRSLYGTLVADGSADIFLTYCTNAVVARRDDRGLQVVALPEVLRVSADYGLTVVSAASPDAYRFALFILSEIGQQILANHGFAVPSSPH
jgi:molybdate transport system substrate-binding protein